MRSVKTKGLVQAKARPNSDKLVYKSRHLDILAVIITDFNEKKNISAMPDSAAWKRIKIISENIYIFLNITYFVKIQK